MASPNKKSGDRTKFDGMEKSSSDQEKTFRGSTRIESPIGNANGESIESLTKRMERQAKKVKEDYGKMEITIDRIQDESRLIMSTYHKTKPYEV